jgi:DNA-binding LacI/PurR family transcriptional regulator
MKATIKDVASLAKVSIATVSRVLNNQDNVSLETKRKVQLAMHKLDYQPNVLAQRFVRNISHLIAVVIDERGMTAMDQFILVLLQGVFKVTKPRGYDVILIPGTDLDVNYKSLVAMFNQNMYDGVILTSPTKNQLPYLNLLQAKVPVVVSGRVPEGIPISTIDNDNVKATYVATKYLLELGHRRIAYIGGPSYYWVGEERLNGYKKAISEAGLTISPELVVEDSFDFAGGYRSLQQLLACGADFTAICVYNDPMAIGTIKGLKDRGYKVPGDVSVIGCDNLPIGMMVEPALSTIQSNISQVGEITAKLLFEALEGGESEVTHNLLPLELVKRESCRILA